MKKVLFSLAIIAASFAANAQSEGSSSKFKFSVGAEVGLPVGDLGDFSSLAVGGSVQGDYWVDPSFALTVQAGYQRFLAKDNNGLELGVIPILAGGKYNFSEKVYGSAQLGVGIFTSGGSNSSAFAYAPGVGFKFTDNLDALLKYQAYSKNSVTNSTIGLRIAYTFGN